MSALVQPTTAKANPNQQDDFKETTLKLIVHPHIELLLTSPKTGFKSDDEYLNLLESIFGIHFLIYDSREVLSRNMLGFIDKVNIDDMIQKQNIYNGLLSLLKQLKNLMKLRLSLSQIQPNNSNNNINDDKNVYYEPRLERLGKKLTLTSKELIALQYIVLHNIGIKFPTNHRSFDGRGMLRNMALMSNMSSREVLNFLSPKRRHIRDCLFESSDDALCFEFSGTSFKMSKEILSAIMGCDLTSEQFLMVDNTALGELLIEEGVIPSNLPSNLPPSPKAVTKILTDDDNNNNEDLFALLQTLKKGDKMDKNDEKDDNKIDQLTTPTTSVSVPNELSSYIDDLDYLVDHFKVIELRIKLYLSNLEEQDSYKFQSKGQKTTLRELKSSEKQAYKKCLKRMEITRNNNTNNGWLPRLERLAVIRNLDEFEKWVILTLIGCIISVDIIKAAGLTSRYRDAMTVGEMLAANCTNLREQISYRKYFYKTGTLVRENIIKVHESRLLHNSDLMHSCLEIDRRMVDYCVALDTEFGALVEGSSLYTPNITLNQVILSSTTKQLIIDTIEGMDKFKKIIKNTVGGMSGMNDNGNIGQSYVGNGLVILFHGISGTGKTMMANAIANYLKRKILLINYTKIQNGDKTEELLKLSFREAKIQNAIIFFDECEGLFESRDLRGNKNVNIILNIIEQYDDIIILATNRPYDLDEAMYRRIQLAVEFPPPDIHLRQEIWKNHIPSQIKLDPNVNLYLLSTEYELTGGFIRNAVITSIKNALLRNKHNKTQNNDIMTLTQDDLRNACRQQIVGQLQLTGFNRRVIPQQKLEDMVLNDTSLNMIQSIILRNKSSKVLSGQWGFNQEGTCILVTGSRGVGKSTIAEVIAYECGKPMKVLTCSELLYLHRTTFHSSSKSGQSVDNIFSDLNNGAVLVIEGCEILFRDGYNSDNIINYLLFQIRRVTTMFIFIFNGVLHNGSILGLSPIQKTFFNYFHFILKLPKPNTIIRSKLWLKLIPNKTPINKNDINLKKTLTLSEKFPNFVHTEIKRSIIKAASIACLRKDIKKRILTYDDLLNAANNLETQMEQDGLRLGFHHMYS